MLIERLQVEDIQSLLQLYKELTHYENSIENSIEIYKDMLMDEKYLIVVAKENNIVIGSALAICCRCLGLGGNCFLVIEEVIVKDGLRGNGIGTKLMQTIDEFAKMKHCVFAIVVSSSYRKEAHEFYTNIGFTEDVRGFRKGY